MLQDFTDGISGFIKALKQISTFKLWPYLFLSGFISLAIGGSIFWSSYSFASTAGAWIASFYRWKFASGIVSTMASWASGLAIVVGGFMLFKYVMLIVLSPIMSVVSARVETKITGKANDSSFSLSQVINDLLRGIRITLRNLSREMILMLILFVLSFVPTFGIVTAPLMFLIQVYYVGFGNMDYFMERHFDVRGASSFVSRHKGLAIANGMLFTGLLFVPVIGLFLAPMLATVSATTMSLERIPDLHLNEGPDYV